jgi:hypothetical protein
MGEASCCGGLASLHHTCHQGIAVRLAQTSFRCALLLLAAQLSSIAANAQEATSHAAWNALFDRTAEADELFRGEEQTLPLLLRPEPVYKWKAASTGDDTHGSVYVWTYRGCPEAVACYWRWGSTITTISAETHIQIAVRNADCILGAFLPNL